MTHPTAEISPGVHNLLINCAGLQQGDRVLLVHEDPQLGWWDADLVNLISSDAKRIGIDIRLLQTGPPTNHRDEAVNHEMESYDCTIFLARMGDQDRFATPVEGKKVVMCYARDTDMLASAFGCTEHRAMYQLKLALDSLISEAKQIEVGCPGGTRYNGSIAHQAPSSESEVSILRFPLGVISPIDASHFSGQIVLANYLTPTGSAVYEPACLKLEHPIVAQVENGNIKSFEGEPAQVKLVEQHYKAVANRFAINPYVVDSWHVGMHQGLSYPQNAEDDPDRWSNTVFNHPHFMHLHTCGDYPPGEICWLVFNQTIIIDGKELWRAGELCLENFEKTRNCLQKWPTLQNLFSLPPGSTGLSA